VGKRSRQRARETGVDPGADKLPPSEYPDGAGNLLVLRASLPPAARREYTDTLKGGLYQEDAWQRAIELLFERLAVTWTISEVSFDRQKELLGRYRVASAEERRFVRDTLRAHLAEHFPELDAP
jgi:hypothetical protein